MKELGWGRVRLIVILVLVSQEALERSFSLSLSHDMTVSAWDILCFTVALLESKVTAGLGQ